MPIRGRAASIAVIMYPDGYRDRGGRYGQKESVGDDWFLEFRALVKERFAFYLLGDLPVWVGLFLLPPGFLPSFRVLDFQVFKILGTVTTIIVSEHLF